MSSDVIFGPVTANIALLPREGAIGDGRYHLTELWHLRERLRNFASIENTASSSKIMITIVVRRFGRFWSQATIDALSSALLQMYPPPIFTIQFIDDFDSNLTSCFPCLIRMFSQTNILIGAHGAGLAHMVAMKSRNVVVSTFSADVFYPPLSYFDMLASSLGLHHYTYTPGAYEKSFHRELNVSDFLLQIHAFIGSGICTWKDRDFLSSSYPHWCSLYSKSQMKEMRY